MKFQVLHSNEVMNVDESIMTIKKRHTNCFL